MYQYVISEEVAPPFSLYLTHPRTVLVMSNQSVTPLSNVLVFVEMETESFDQNVIDVFTDTKVNKIHN